MSIRSAIHCMILMAGTAFLMAGCQPSTSDRAAQQEAKATATAAAEAIAANTDQAKTYGTVEYDKMTKAPAGAPLQMTGMPHSISAEAAAAKTVNPAALTAMKSASVVHYKSLSAVPEAKP